MSAQEHDYELGTLDHETLERDESLARHNKHRGDERRWMILGGAGTLALMTALAGAVALGGSSEPRHLASSLGSPARDLAALAARAVVGAKTESAAEAAKPARVARKTAASAAEPKKSLDAPVTAKPNPAAAIPAATTPAAASPATPPKPATPTPAPTEPKDESEDNAFSGLPSLPAVDDARSEAGPEAAAPVDFTRDDNPFVDEDEEDEDDEDEDDEDAAPA